MQTKAAAKHRLNIKEIPIRKFSGNPHNSPAKSRSYFKRASFQSFFHENALHIFALSNLGDLLFGHMHHIKVVVVLVVPLVIGTVGNESDVAKLKSLQTAMKRGNMSLVSIVARKFSCLLKVAKISSCYLLWSRSYELWLFCANGQHLKSQQKSDLRLSGPNGIFSTFGFNCLLPSVKVSTHVGFQIESFNFLSSLCS